MKDDKGLQRLTTNIYYFYWDKYGGDESSWLIIGKQSVAVAGGVCQRDQCRYFPPNNNVTEKTFT